MTLAVGSDLQEVPLEHRQIVCPAHGEPLRAEFPRGWATFATIVSERALASPALQTGLSDPRFWKHPNLRWGDLPRPVGVARVLELLNAQPACEWVEPGVLLSAYVQSGVGRMGLCRLCGILRAGTPYGVVSGRGRDIVQHVCFHCVATGRTRQ